MGASNVKGAKVEEDRYLKIFRRSISRDNLWVLADEQAELKKGRFPQALAERIARFHLIDNTRGEPTMWSKDAVKSLKVEIDEQGKVTGSAVLEDSELKTGYEVAVLGYVKFNDNKTELQRFDLVAKGTYYGEGKWTRNALDGKFPLAVTFRVADGTDVADSVAPQGTKGWIGQYLENQ